MSTLDSKLADRYTIEEVIAAAPHSVVYRARDRRTNDLVCLKSVDVTNPHGVARVVAEAHVLRRVNHPALPRMIDIFVDDKGAWLVMSFVPGDDLGRQLERALQPFGAGRVLAWGEQVLDALAYLHSLTPPIVHCDIKPANLKVDEEDRVFLLDFGVAHARNDHQDHRGYTLAYAAPEQLTGVPIDLRADLYALAATLYDLLTGVKPPDARQRLAALAEGRSDPLLPASAWNPVLPRTLDAFLHQGMALDPTQRFVNATTMRQSLHACRAGLPAHSDTVTAKAVDVIGREALIREVRRKLLQPDLQLLTLIGPGGVGKTAILHAVVSDLHSGHFHDVLFLDLEDALPPLAQQRLQLIQEHIARYTGQPSNDAAMGIEPKQGSPHSWLLVIDAGERLASSEVALDALLASAPYLKVLAASRRPMGARSEHLVPVAPLPTPDRHAEVDVSTALHSPAVQMFLAQARACGVDLQITGENTKEIVDLCAALDGLPLALTEAARRLRTLDISEITGHLCAELARAATGAPSTSGPRDSLAASIAWSVAQLTPQQQSLLLRLTVFSGSFSSHAAHAVCCAGVAALEGFSEADAAASLKELATQSLLATRADDVAPRFVILNTMRAFASARLAAFGDVAALRRRHAHYFVNLIEVDDTYVTPDAARLARIETEYDNLLAALTWSVENGDANAALRLTTSMWRFWEIRGDYRAGLDWFERALALSETEAELRARALSCAGALARNQSQYAAAERCFSAALAIYQELNDKQGIARMLNGLGTVAYFQDAAIAINYFEAALSMYRELNNPRDMAGALNNLALLAEGQGDYPRAATLHQQALELFRALGEAANTAYVLGNLGVVAEHSGDLDAAVEYYQQSLDLHEQIGESWGMAAMLTNLGSTLDRLQRVDEALPLLIEGLSIFHELGDHAGVAQALGALAYNADRRKAYHDSVQFLAAAERIEAETGYVLPTIDQAERHAVRTRLQAALGADAYAATWQIAYTLPITSLLPATPGIHEQG